ncbi:efflux RND transporter periplasmic adaptor subunit [Thalassoglobus neptunius]|uniref:efflux RND transporter periplasmic adaptor subunit n=1 Tax=Thalassoglobus neptunius TaxID=1938619 RepID=UPI001E39CA23|nr:HlyD family efflux transporter periplasmic adaptor subunit [Thalassoglobus neptunius]
MADVLESSFEEHAQLGNQRRSLIPIVAKNISQQLKTWIVGLWQVDDQRCVRLWPVEPTPESLGLEAEISRIQPGSVVQAVLQNSTASPNRTIVCAGSPLAGTMSVIVALDSENRSIDEASALQLSDLLSDLRRRELLATLSSNSQKSAQIVHWITQIHMDRSETERLHALATDGALLSGADRIVLFKRKSQRNWEFCCSTGTDSFASRSSEINQLRARLVEAQEKNESTDDLFPLSPSGSWEDATYACVVDASSESSSYAPNILRLLADQFAMAIDQPNRKRQAHQRSRKKFIKRMLTAATLAFAGMIIIVLLTMKTDLKIHVVGEIYPVVRQQIFSPETGVITEVFVEHGQQVKQGDFICQLRSDRLEVLREQIREELISTQARLAALQTISPRMNTSSVNGGLPVTVEQSELAERVSSLEEQLKLVTDQLNTLTIRAPFDGQVIRERVREELLGRPVQQGQFLFQLIDPKSDWEVVVRIPERELRHVLDAQTEEELVPLTYLLETSPEHEHSSEIIRISDATEMDSTGNLSTRAWAPVQDDQPFERRLGAGVLGRVHCGQRTWFSVLTRGFSEFWLRYSPF